jgi:plastocyanin
MEGDAMSRTVVVVAVLALGIVPLAAGCGSSSSSSGPTSTEASSEGGGQTTVAGVEANDHGTTTVGDEAKLELDDDYFEPTVLEGKPGQKVTLELENEGKLAHTFTIDSERIDKNLEPGDEAKVTVTMPKSGSLSFYCKYHKSAGMAGALAVKGGGGGMSGSGTTTNEDSGKGGY